jgi:putative ABC transport system permease protein
MRLPLLPFRTAADWLTAIAMLGMLLAGVGLHALVSYSVVQRTREIGVRVALGAQPRDIVSLVLRRVLAHIVIGALIGTIVAWAMAQILTSVLYRVSPADPIGLALAAMATAVVALIAASAPTLRALQVDPVNALRQW